MTRRTLLQTLLGTGLQAVAAASPVTRWRAMGRPHLYQRVGTNPRGVPVLSWQDALSYMQGHPKFWKDLTVLLPQGLEPEVRAAYWPRVVQDVHDGVELAQAHHFMNGTCPICSARGSAHCERAIELSHRFQRLAIPHGTQYLSLTEGQDGQVTFNRIFIGDAIAYRVNVLEGRAFIDLIARCRNTALGQRPGTPWVWEAYTAFTPPAHVEWETHTASGPPPVLAATGPVPAPSMAHAEGGSVTINNYAAQAPTPYIGPGPAQYYSRGYQAGSLTFWTRPDVRVRINQTTPPPVAAAAGSPAPAPASQTERPPLVVGPTPFQVPTPTAAAAGIPVQGPPQAAPPAPSLMQFSAPTPTPGPVVQTQGPAQH